MEYRQYGQDLENKFIARYNENIKQHDTLVVNGKRYRILYLETPIDPTDFMEIYTEGERL